MCHPKVHFTSSKHWLLHYWINIGFSLKISRVDKIPRITGNMALNPLAMYTAYWCKTLEEHHLHLNKCIYKNKNKPTNIVLFPAKKLSRATHGAAEWGNNRCQVVREWLPRLVAQKFADDHFPRFNKGRGKYPSEKNGGTSWVDVDKFL